MASIKKRKDNGPSVIEKIDAPISARFFYTLGLVGDGLKDAEIESWESNTFARAQATAAKVRALDTAVAAPSTGD